MALHPLCSSVVTVGAIVLALLCSQHFAQYSHPARDTPHKRERANHATPVRDPRGPGAAGSAAWRAAPRTAPRSARDDQAKRKAMEAELKAITEAVEGDDAWSW